MIEFEDIDLEMKREESKNSLEQRNLSYDDLLNEAAYYKIWSELVEEAYNTENEMRKAYKQVVDKLLTALPIYEDQNIKNIEQISEAALKDVHQALSEGRSIERKLKATHAANVRHSKPGGSRDLKEKIQAIWATGKYTSRDICAEQECSALGISFSTARKALINTPDPN